MLEICLMNVIPAVGNLLNVNPLNFIFKFVMQTCLKMKKMFRNLIAQWKDVNFPPILGQIVEFTSFGNIARNK